MLKKKTYIRIGEIPIGEKSKIHRGDAVIGEEDGVSVYNAVNIKDKWHIVMPIPFKEGQGVYLVTGCEVGTGSDNEPLIKNVIILKDLTSQFK